MLVRIYGIMGHRNYFPKPDLIITVYRLLLLWVAAMAIRYWKKPSYSILSTLIIFFFYILVLLVTNFEGELSFGFRNIAVQGRYIFPVIGIFYTMMVYFILKIRNSVLCKLTSLVTIFVFIYISPIVTLILNYRSTFSSWFL